MEISTAAAAVLLLTVTTALLSNRGGPDPKRQPEALLSPFYTDQRAADAAERVRRVRDAAYQRNAEMPESVRPTVPGPLVN
jgi:hypothetical protein